MVPILLNTHFKANQMNGLAKFHVNYGKAWSQFDGEYMWGTGRSQAS